MRAIGSATTRSSETICNSRCTLQSTTNGSAMRDYGGSADAYTRSYRRFWSVRPIAFLAYEQMFASTKNSSLAQRTLGALRLTRSFLLLEDDYDVDWEVDLDELLTQTTHPHRASLRGPGSRSRRLAKRRPGQSEPARHHCLSPVRDTPHRRVRQGAAR